MHKKILPISLLLLSLVMTACGNLPQSTNNPQTGFQTDGPIRELPQSAKLAIGTLKLEGTEFAVASDQAAELLPLWQILNNLSSSDSAAPEEVTAVTEQIQETMSAEQLQAIDEMQLTPEDMFATMQELGLAGGPRVDVSVTPQPGREFGGGQGPVIVFGPGGGPPGGGPGGDGPGGGFSGQGLNPEQIATAQARRAEGGPGFGNRVPAPLVEAVIKLLESKTGS